MVRNRACAARARCFSLLSLIGLAFALDFPPLTGRVVDQADVMTPQSRSDIETKLKDLEDKSGIQLVVATVKSLQGGDIETYANELFRTWKLGQAQKNNGVLLLVAPNEHKVRIEVGYGLEGTLTDALSSVIISSAIVPRFKTGDFSGGITRGVDGIISVLSGDTSDWQRKVEVRKEDPAKRFRQAVSAAVLFADHLHLLVPDPQCRRRRSFEPRRHTRAAAARSSFPRAVRAGAAALRRRFGGGGFGGGFGGGGGSSGGGGASGGW